MLILGGDHLGSLVWQGEPESSAMEKAERLIGEYVAAGFTKIHIDASMPLAGDRPGGRLTDEIIARRTARLALAAETAYAERLKHVPDAQAPVYVAGSEVPTPGGHAGGEAPTPGGKVPTPGGDILRSNTSETPDGAISITPPSRLLETCAAIKTAFTDAGLGHVLPRLAAVVVQPGVEFGDDQVIEYESIKARSLTAALPQCGGIVFEGHSTDYQTRYKLKEMVKDGVAILKVGPALTFALREAYFALECIEKELSVDYPSNFSAALEESMKKKPENWNRHYHGNENELQIKRRFSLSDRCRYYLPDKPVRQAAGFLVSNINSADVPLSLYSQYLPTVYAAIREGRCATDAESILKMRVKDCIGDYLYATGFIPAT